MVEMLRPFVYWGQKNDSLSLRIDLQDVTVDKLDLSEEKLNICLEGVGSQGRNKYGFEIEFYLPINKEESKLRTTDRALEISIPKQGEEAWPRLTREQLRQPWLKIDFDKMTFEDDSEPEDTGMSEQQASDDIMRKLEHDLMKDTEPQFDIHKIYLMMYNFIQFLGYLYIVMTLSYNYVRLGSAVTSRAVEIVGVPLQLCQLLSVCEIIHPLVGLVKTGVTSPIMQVAGRNVNLFMLILQDIRLQDAPVVYYLFMTWSAVEVIRYPFYMFSSLGMDVKLITWLRYTAWIPLYPIGIICEGIVVIMAIPLFEESLKFSLQLPNTANFAFYFPWFLRVYPFLLATGGYVMMKHMYKQMKKRLGSSTKYTASKKKQ